MTEKTKPEQDAMTPGRRAFEAWFAVKHPNANSTGGYKWMSDEDIAAWEAAAAAVIADATKGGE